MERLSAAPVSCKPGFSSKTPRSQKLWRATGKPVSINEGTMSGKWKAPVLAKYARNGTLRTLFCEDHRLHAGNLEAFAAAHVLAHHHVVSAQHVRTGFSEAGAITLVGPSWQLPLLGANQPSDFVLRRLVAVGAVEGCRFLIGFLVEKIALFHVVVGRWSLAKQILHLAATPVWQHDRMARKKKIKRFGAVQAVKELARERIGTIPVAQVVPDRKKKKA